MSRLGRTSVLRLALAAFALLLGGLAAAPTAGASSAERFAVGSAEFERARHVAQARWGAVPCQGRVTFSWQGLEPLTNARASWSNPTDAWNNAGANFDCIVVFNELTQYDFPMLCTVMAHELGHLLGRAHDAQDGRLMSAIYSTPLPECGGAAQEESSADGDPMAWSANESKARKRKSANRSATKSVKRKRCVVRLQSGKRTRRCVVLKGSSRRKARAAGFERQARRYVAR